MVRKASFCTRCKDRVKQINRLRHRINKLEKEFEVVKSKRCWTCDQLENRVYELEQALAILLEQVAEKDRLFKMYYDVFKKVVG